MRRYTDLTGKIFGRLTIISLEKDLDKSRNTIWLCKCSCGSYKKIRADSLKSGRTISCGCAMRRLSSEQALYNRVVSGIKNGAKQRKLNFELTEEQIKNLIHKPCVYCTRTNISCTTRYHIEEKLYHNGLDRIDGTKGYTIDNVQPACGECNTLRFDTFTIEETKAMVKALWNYRNNKI